MSSGNGLSPFPNAAVPTPTIVDLALWDVFRGTVVRNAGTVVLFPRSD